MKYVLAGLGVAGAVAALFFRPPHSDPAAPAPPEAGTATLGRTRLPSGHAALADRPRGPISRVSVYVAGEVVKPGVYTLASGARAEEALARAGGAKPDADLVAVNLAAVLVDGAEIAVPKIGEATVHRRREPVPRAHAARVPRTRRHNRTAAPDAPPQTVDLNLAGVIELQTIPGIGPALAARIIAYRDINGPFTSVDELGDISGITPKLQDEIADLAVIR